MNECGHDLQKKKMHIIEYAVCEKWPVSSWIEHATGFVVWHHAIHFKTYIHIHLENYHSINNKRQLMVFLYTYADLTTFEWLPHSLAQLWRICLLASSNNYISRDFFLFSFLIQFQLNCVHSFYSSSTFSIFTKCCALWKKLELQRHRSK